MFRTLGRARCLSGRPPLLGDFFFSLCPLAGASIGHSTSRSRPWPGRRGFFPEDEDFFFFFSSGAGLFPPADDCFFPPVGTFHFEKDSLFFLAADTCEDSGLYP